MNFEDVKDVVQNCQKQRYALKYENNDAESNPPLNTIFIKANQGHSLNEIEVELNEIVDPESIKNCIHGTYFRSWDIIKNEASLFQLSIN